jgi:glycosyltransferase involved in cell wall biosynthesis
MNVNIVICTWNRAALLDQTLATMRGLEIPHGVVWELIVVNNNCTDDTDAVIARHAKSLPIRRLFEPVAGKSFAANLAVACAEGELIIFTDDDVLVDKNWMSEYVKVARERPDVLYFGGPAEPWFAAEPPEWIRRNLSALSCVYAIRRVGLVPRPIEATEAPIGVNMAIRREVFSRVAFDTRVGPRCETQVRGEDSVLIDRLKGLGCRGLWVPTARLRHYIPRRRMRSSYIWDYFVGIGKTVERLEGPRDDACWLGAPRWAVKRYLLNRAKAWLLSPRKGTAWLTAWKRAAWAKGILIEARARRSRAKRRRPCTTPQAGGVGSRGEAA